MSDSTLKLGIGRVGQFGQFGHRVALGFLGLLLTTATVDAQVIKPGSVAGEPILLEDTMSSLPSLEELATVHIEPQVVALAQQLGADSFHARQVAMQSLQNGDMDLTQLLSVLHQFPLTLEQQHRLTAVVRDRIINIPRGALGIRMHWHDATKEVEVLELLPDLPAQRVLRRHDRIFEIDGLPLRDGNALLWRVQSKRPGDTIAVTLRRLTKDHRGKVQIDEDGMPIYTEKHVEFELGSAQKLQEPDPRFAARRPNLVVRSRIGVADDAASRFGPSPHIINIDNPPGTSIAMQIPDAPVTDRRIEMHPAILDLRKQLRRMGANPNDTKLQSIRNHWTRQLFELTAESTQPGLSDNQRKYLVKVIEHYRLLAGIDP